MCKNRTRILTTATFRATQLFDVLHGNRENQNPFFLGIHERHREGSASENVYKTNKMFTFLKREHLANQSKGPTETSGGGTGQDAPRQPQEAQRHHRSVCAKADWELCRGRHASKSNGKHNGLLTVLT